MASNPVTSGPVIRFGDDLELDLRTRKVRRAGSMLKLERIPMELLALLVERRRQLVTRQEIVERIWGKDVFFDTDNSINGAVRKIRQVLKDDPEDPQFIETISGQGYRFIALVKLESEAPAEPLAIPATVIEIRTVEPPRRSRGWAVPVVVVLLIATAATMLLWRSRHKAPATGRMMLAVLPFENLTGDPGQEYFSDGLTDEMINRLGNLDPQHMGVIARTSVMRYKQNRQPTDKVTRELGVQYLIEGSVRRDAGKIRVTAELIGVDVQTPLWSRQYDRELSSVLAVQAEIAQAVANEIHLALTNSQAAPALPLSTSRYEAYDLYLKGRYFWNKRSPEDLQLAIEHFQKSIATDSSYAPAYAGLADSYALTSGYIYGRPEDLIPKARAAALRALELDEGLAEAHASLGLILLNYDYNWKGAEKEYRRAIELNPNYATAHHWYAELLGFQGRFDEALAESERARQLDPLSLIIAADRGAILYYARRYDESIQQLRTVLASDPNILRAHMISYPYAEQGRFTEALDDLKNWRHRENAPLTWGLEAYLNGRQSQLPQARQALEKISSTNQDQRWDAAPLFALAYAGMNDKEKTLNWLEACYREHSNSLTNLKVDPMFDPVRDDPRFQQLLKRIHLSE